MLPKTKTSYRVVLASLGVLSLIATIYFYVSHTIKAFYFKAQSHDIDYVWIGLFSLLFVGLVLEFISLWYFSYHQIRQNEKIA